MIIESMQTLAHALVKQGCASVYTTFWHPYKNIFFYPSAKREKDKNTPMHTHIHMAWNKNKAAEWIESFFTVTGHAYCVYVH